MLQEFLIYSFYKYYNFIIIFDFGCFMEVNRNKELSQFFMLWKMKNESNKIDWLNFISNFSKKNPF